MVSRRIDLGRLTVRGGCADYDSMHLMRALFVAALLAATACSDSSPSTSPSSIIQIGGAWTGTAAVPGSPAGTGSARTTLTQSGSHVSGTWSLTFPDSFYNLSGSLSGTVGEGGTQLTLTPSVPTACPYLVVADLHGSTLSGTFSTMNCTVAQSGSIRLSRS
jgi:hypothetical protein